MCTPYSDDVLNFRTILEPSIYVKVVCTQVLCAWNVCSWVDNVQRSMDKALRPLSSSCNGVILIFLVASLSAQISFDGCGFRPCMTCQPHPHSARSAPQEASAPSGIVAIRTAAAAPQRSCGTKVSCNTRSSCNRTAV